MEIRRLQELQQQLQSAVQELQNQGVTNGRIHIGIAIMLLLVI